MIATLSRRSVPLQALVAQFMALPFTFAAFQGLLAIYPNADILQLAWLQGGCALGVTVLYRLPRWWWPMQTLFWPAMIWVVQKDFHPLVALAVFLLLALLFSGVARSRIPLFLSSQRATVGLLELMAKRPSVRLLDIGCGFGGVLIRIAGARPDIPCCGIENAPLVWLVAKLRIMRLGLSPHCEVRFGSFWMLDLGEFDVVYAYLSPEPMPALWRKVLTQMKPGSLFISNTFIVPGIEPDEVVQVEDWNCSPLYVWRIGSRRPA